MCGFFKKRKREEIRVIDIASRNNGFLNTNQELIDYARKRAEHEMGVSETRKSTKK